jgi:phenylalanyl-tRNA synthetase alpha chain
MDQDKIHNILTEIDGFKADTPKEIEDFKVSYFGKKGVIKGLFSLLKNIPPEERKLVGQLINKVKVSAEAKLKSILAAGSTGLGQMDKRDLTRPGEYMENGTRHPISIVKNQMIDILKRVGFIVSEGPEIETDWHNFTALNIPKHHPARDMQDTFFIQTDPDILLRTHTSPQQIRVMESTQPPIRIICPGRVYRNETISARSHCIFHQIEGLYIDESVSFVDLKQTLYFFATEMFGDDTKIRFRPSYFPFTEPSAEMDISCLICNGKGCPVCKDTGWVEILGCGMVDPAVLENCKIDSSRYTGFAFGLGVERPAMLKYRINDIRLFFENDVRFLKQFTSA